MELIAFAGDKPGVRPSFPPSDRFGGDRPRSGGGTYSLLFVWSRFGIVEMDLTRSALVLI